MDRLVATLLLLLIVAVMGVGVVVWRADQRARAHSQELLCLERAHATASIALLAPRSRVDPDGRVAAMQALGNDLEAC